MTAWSEYVKRLAGADQAKIIAGKSGVDTSQVSRWMSGKSRPSAENALRFAEAYSASPAEALAAAGHLSSDDSGEPRWTAADLATELSALQAALHSAYAAEDDDERARLEQQLSGARARFARHQWDVRQEERMKELEQYVALSFRADEVDSAASAIWAPEPSADPDDVQDFIYEVEALVSASNELTDSVHKTVLDAFGGDVAKLRQMKREVQRAN